MSPQHDLDLANNSGAAFRSDLNLALEALQTNSSGATEITDADSKAYQFWADTGSSPAVMKMRNGADNGWITLFNLDGSSLPIASATEIVFNDAGADLDFRIEGDTEANLFFIDAGNDGVGIGTNSVSDKLEISNGATDAANALGVRSGRYLNAAQEGAQLKFYSDQTSSWLGTREMARIGTYGLSSDHRIGSLAFLLKTTNSASDPSEMMRLTPTGLGIGATDPSHELHIAGSGDTRALITSGGSGDAVMMFENASGNTWGHGLDLSSGNYVIAYNSSGDPSLSTQGVLNIDSSGRLLVGSTTAATGTESQYSKLVVAGNTNSSTSAGILNIRKNSGAGSTDYLGRLVYSDDDHDFAYIDSIADGSTTAGRLAFSTCASGGSSPTEQMRMTSTGVLQFQNYNNTDALYTLSTGYGVSIYNGSQAAVIVARTNDTTMLLNRCGTNGSIVNFYKAGYSVGSISVDSSSTAYNTSSDYRLKENIVSVADGIDRLKQLNPRRFNFIVEPNKTVDGFVAHEVQDIVPEAVTGEKDAVEVWKEGDDLPDGVSVGANKLDDDGNTIPAYQGIDQSKLVPLLTAALQEAIAKIETLETKVAALESA